MTTFQDPQPHSRRAARESERAARLAEGLDSELPPDFDDSEVRGRASGRRVRTDEVDGDTGPVTSRYDSSPFQVTAPEPGPSAAQFRTRDFSPEGRRSAGPSSPIVPPSSPLDYRTQQADARGYEHPADQQTPMAEALLAAPPPQGPPVIPAGEPTGWPFAASAPFPAPPAADPIVTVPARSEWAPSAPAPVDDASPVFLEPHAPSAESDERADDAVESVDDVAAPAEAAPDAVQPDPETPPALIDPTPTSEQRVLTRRELRLLEAQAAAAAAGEQPVDAATDGPAPLVEPAAQQTSPDALHEAVAGIDDIPGFEAFLRARPTPEPAKPFFAVPDEQPVAETTSERAPWPAFASAPAPAVSEPAVSEPEAAEPTEVEPVDAEPIPAEADAEPAEAETPAPAAAASVPVAPDAEDLDTDIDLVLGATTPPPFAEPPVQRSSYTPPPGHWSRQADLDDETQPFENTLSREVGGAAATTTTSALILPSIPQDDFAAAINGTGEILITGSINLPRGFGTTGADHRNLDDPNVDKMFEAFDGETVSNDSQPVRAIRAVSTHTATQGIIVQPRKVRGNKLLTVGLVAVGVLVVGVIGLLAVYIFKLA